MKLSQRTMINQLLKGAKAVGSEVTVAGWVKSRRDSKKGFSFVMVNDGSTLQSLQLIVNAELDNYAEILKLTAGSSILAQGQLVASPGAKQAVELQVTQLAILGLVDDPEHYPISPKFHTAEYLREFAHLRARSMLISSIMRVRHCISMAIHEFFHQHGFYWIHTPLITTSDCEGAGQMFRVTTLDLNQLPHTPAGRVDFSQDFFGRESFLTVSGQLNVESYCCALGRVYTFGPTFRAENSNTGRHLSEFWMVEPEIAFADLQENAQWAVDLLKFIVQKALQQLPNELDFFTEKLDATLLPRLEKLLQSPVQHVDYTQAIELLLKSGQQFQYPVTWGVDLQSEHERYLTEQVFEAPVVLQNYPKEIKSFYMRLNEDGRTVAAMDLLVPGVGEIIGGSQREERFNLLKQRVLELGLKLEDYAWYLDLRRYGTVPHSGFGLGLERAIMYITGVNNIRDVIPFPRTPKHAEF